MSAGDGASILGSGHREFACHTPAGPDRVWSALTDAEQTPHYLYGLTLRSSWQPGEPIEATNAGCPALTGRVLCVVRPSRLSYLLQAGPSDPPLFLTWLLRAGPGGCTVRLQVDEIDCADSAEVAEDVWLPVLARLQNEVR